jgi:ribose/xylose/arabinose/galactoside ABC-type transport system permease subunit
VEEKVISTEAAAKKAQRTRFLKDNNSILILVAILFIAFIGVDGFTGTWYNVVLYSAEYGICCLGLALVMICGNIDLSVGYNAAFCGVIFVSVYNVIYNSTGSAVPAIIVGLIAALITGGLLGAFNGVIITKIGVSPLIATIATNYIYQGLVMNYAKTSYAPVNKDPITPIAKYQIFGLKWLTPMVIIFVLFIVGVYLWMRMTKYGNRLHIVGDNPEAAEFAGISVSKTAFTTFVLCGIMAGMTGFMMVSFTGAAIYTQGTTLGTFPISCVIIGGIKMTGGKGTAVHVLLGVLIMRCVSTMMSTMFWDTNRVNMVTGILLIAVLIVDRFTSAKGAND